MTSIAFNQHYVKQFLGWAGSFFGIGGAILLALNIAISGWGYVLFLTSSVFLLCWSVMDNQRHQITMNVVFTVINMIGLWRWLIA